MVVRMRANRSHLEQQEGPLPSPGILIPIGVPLIILLLGWGELPVQLVPLRWVGVAISLYSLIMVPWMMAVLGRQALPGAGILKNHRLVTDGPYRLVRHPLFSAGAVLWLAAGLGTMNWLLLALFPVLLIVMIQVPMQQEERLLREKFGTDYYRHAQGTSRLIPGLW
jgi:protein-S-isoprenylcysteine O-methyltransferase